MDFVTETEQRVLAVARRLWATDNALVECYKAEGGDSLEGFCTDLAKIIALIDQYRQAEFLVNRIWHNEHITMIRQFRASELGGKFPDFRLAIAEITAEMDHYDTRVQKTPMFPPDFGDTKI